MKKELLLLVIVIQLVLTLPEEIGIKATANTGRAVTISKLSADISGDEKKEMVKLTGVKMKGEKYQNLKIEITASNNEHYMIKLPKGVKPNLQLADLNQDGVKDLFASVSTAKNSINTWQTIYSFKDFKLSKVANPEPLILESRFVNGYKAKIRIRKTGDSYLFDLKNRKKYYETLGVFYKGKLNEPTELMVNSFNDLKPVLLKGEQIGLKGTQKITGVTDSDTIGNVESTWLYEQSQWNLVNVDVLKKD